MFAYSTKTSVQIAALTIGTVLVSTMTGFAQSVDEIIVTAQKREQSLQDVPFSVSANTGARLEEMNVNDLTDLQTVIAGLQSPSTGSPGEGSSMRLRGFGSPPFQLGIEPAVATFIDGVYRSRSGTAVNDLIDIERVEVLKGPQGTLFGKNTTAGVVHVITKRPEIGANDGYIKVSASSYSTYRVEGVTNVSLSETSALRLSANIAEGDGWLENDGPVNDLHDTNRYTFRGQMAFEPSDNLSINLSLDFSEIDENCCATVRYADGPFTGPINGLAAGIGQLAVSPDNFRNYKSVTNDEESNQAEDYGFSAEIVYEMPNGMELTSITSYRDYDLTTIVDGDFTGADILVIDTDIGVETLTQELRLSNEFAVGDRMGNWMAGLYYTDEEITRVRSFIWQPQALLYYPPGFGPTAAGLGLTDDLSQDSTSYSLFANVEIPLSDRFTMTGGVRWNDEEKDGIGAFLQPNNGPLPVVPANFNAKVDEDEVTWSVSAQYDVTDTAMVYANVSTGYKAGGINLAREAALGEATFLPEEVEHLEIGLKSQFADDRVRLNLAIFQDEYENIQNQVLVGQAFIVRNGKGADIEGIEMEAEFAVTENFDLFFTYLDLDTEFVEGTSLGFGDVSGNQLPWAPDQSFSIGWSYAKEMSNGFEFFTGGNYLSRSEYETNAAVDQPLQGDTDLLNARIGVRSADENGWELAAWCRNCTDEEYAEVIFDSPVDFFPGMGAAKEAFVGRPMEVGISLRKDF